MRNHHLLFFLLLLFPGANLYAEHQGIMVASASNLRFVMDEITARYTRSGAPAPRVIYGSSGNLAVQIEHGAPFDLFISADQDYIYRLKEQQLTNGEGVLFAQGQLALFTHHNSPLVAEEGLDGIDQALNDGKVKKFAIPNPNHAPYGRAAKQALEAAGLWQRIQPKLVLGENASQAAQFTFQGGAAAGLIPLTLVLSPGLNQLGQYQVIPVTQHIKEPLIHRMVILKDAHPATEQFVRYLQSDAIRDLLVGNGFIFNPQLP
jgi:molybdate transport system substrate-binding protein